MVSGPILLERGRYRAQFAQTPADVAAAQALRGRAFGKGGIDRDAFDELCRHVLVIDRGAARPVACFRMLELDSGAAVGGCYSATFYDLSRLSGFDGRMLEIGRFCTEAGGRDADILRVAWGAITALVDSRDVRLMFGCTSFPGVDPAPYGDVFSLLGRRHVAPERWRPLVRAAEIVRFESRAGTGAGGAATLRAMPPLLRTYLGMGGWVSDHAVVDRQMGTLHVFTAVEVAAIPPGRQRALRAVVSG